jgi:hypothetical protein
MTADGQHHLPKGDNSDYYGLGSVDTKDKFAMPPVPTKSSGDVPLPAGVSFGWFGEGCSGCVQDPNPATDVYCDVRSPFRYSTSIMANAILKCIAANWGPSTILTGGRDNLPNPDESCPNPCVPTRGPTLRPLCMLLHPSRDCAFAHKGLPRLMWPGGPSQGGARQGDGVKRGNATKHRSHVAFTDSGARHHPNFRLQPSFTAGDSRLVAAA